MIGPAVLRRLEQLLQGAHSATADPLDAGAELTVSQDGDEVFRAPLARHSRVDQDDPNLLWVRALVGGTHTDTGPVFDSGLARRRALAVTAAGLDPDGDVVLELATGQQARIGACAGAHLQQLQHWDTWMSGLSAAEEAALDQLHADS